MLSTLLTGKNQAIRSPLPILPPLPTTWRRDCLILAAVFLASRCAVLAVFHSRGLAFPFMDAVGYLRQAHWLATHGSLLIPDGEGGRFFHGMPLLVSLAGRLTGEFTLTGLALNSTAGVGATLLFYRNVARLDWSVWQVLLLPAWVATSATLHSEAGQWCFCLLGITALRMELPPRTRRLLLVVAGFAVVCRPTAVFIVAPLFAVSLLDPDCSWRSAVADAAAAAVFPVLMAVWAYATTGHIFPESRWQADEYLRWSHRYSGFPEGVFAWPGQSLLAGITGGTVRLPVKVLNLLHVLVWAGGLALAIRAWVRDRSDTLAALVSVELAVNGLFILTVGGPFGCTIYYRFLATQANVFVVWAWMRYARISAFLWWMAGAASVSLASLVASGS